jgi:membrane associated rhomboid family serine protease
VLPLKDNIPTDRLPVVTLLLVAAGAIAIFLAPDGGTLQLIASAIFLWIFGTSVEDSMSRVRFPVFCVLGGAAATGVALLLDRDATVAPIAAAGAAAAVLGGYIRLYPRARVVSATLVPFAVTLIEVPAWGFVGAWFVIQAVLAAVAPAGPDGAGAFLAQAVSFAFGVLAIRAFAQRRKPAPSPPAMAALS